MNLCPRLSIKSVHRFKKCSWLRKGTEEKQHIEEWIWTPLLCIKKFEKIRTFPHRKNISMKKDTEDPISGIPIFLIISAKYFFLLFLSF